jgi:hypothetical protein
MALIRSLWFHYTIYAFFKNTHSGFFVVKALKCSSQRNQSVQGGFEQEATMAPRGSSVFSRIACGHSGAQEKRMKKMLRHFPKCSL